MAELIGDHFLESFVIFISMVRLISQLSYGYQGRVLCFQTLHFTDESGREQTIRRFDESKPIVYSASTDNVYCG